MRTDGSGGLTVKRVYAAPRDTSLGQVWGVIISHQRNMQCPSKLELRDLDLSDNDPSVSEASECFIDKEMTPVALILRVG